MKKWVESRMEMNLVCCLNIIYEQNRIKKFNFLLQWKNWWIKLFLLMIKKIKQNVQNINSPFFDVMSTLDNETKSGRTKPQRKRVLKIGRQHRLSVCLKKQWYDFQSHQFSWTFNESPGNSKWLSAEEY